ncbi:MAG: HNH endonuclease [Candidatus Cryptobacteroides sp.]
MDKMSYYNRAVKNLLITRDANSTSLSLDYVCPLCMKSFPLEVAKVELTEEDVPQKSIGGHRITLTCKQCNNRCGSTIDAHLLETIKGIEQRAYLPGTDRKVTIQNGDKRLFARTGYTFLSDVFYDRLRQQIMTPDPYFLPERLWTFQDVSVPDGIYLTRDNRHRGFFVVYSLKRLLSYRICVLIPTPKVEYLAACMELRKIHSKASIRVMPLPDEDFLCDEISVMKLSNWAYGSNIDL